jgi:hypothetical protein
MASREKLARIGAAHRGETPSASAGVDLDDSHEQDKIMDPPGNHVTVSWGTFKLYPFTIVMRRRASSFVNRILANTYGAGARSASELALRISSILTASDEVEHELLRFAAFAMSKPGAIIEENIEPIIAEMSAQASEDDIALLFNELVTLTKVVNLPNL